MKSDNTLELVEILFKTFRLMKGHMSFSNDLTHLSVLQIHTLIFLKQKKKISMSDIADHFRIELPSATSLLNRLCDQKLVKRYEDEQDRRLVCVALTTKGQTLLDEVMEERKTKLENMLSYLSEKEKTELLTILQTLNTRLQK